ncbi:MAG: DUF6249 domain-containing protein [Bacteroidota bacterium]|nr:DUF6249 domain-containing protein [Bacteroidota bacterium]
MKKLISLAASAWMLICTSAFAVADTLTVDSMAVAQRVSDHEPGLAKIVEASSGTHWDVVALFSVVSPFLTGFLIVLIILIFNHRNKKAKYRLMEKAIEAGREIPQSFFEEKKPKKTPLQSAFALIGTGIGLFLMLWFVADHDVAFVGAIPLLIGLGKLLAYKMEEKSSKSEENDQQNG